MALSGLSRRARRLEVVFRGEVHYETDFCFAG